MNEAANRIDEVVALRRKGHVQRAFNVLNEFLRFHMGDAAVIAEALRLSLLIENHGQVELLWNALGSLPAGRDHLEAGLLHHTAAIVPAAAGLDGDFPSLGRWTADPPEAPADVELTDMQMSVANGVIFFLFDFRCPDCGNVSVIDVRTTLFQDRHFLCRECLLPCRVTPEMTTGFIREQRPDCLDDGLYEYDKRMTAYQKRLGRNDPEIPFLNRALNQEMLGQLNEIVFNRVLGR